VGIGTTAPTTKLDVVTGAGTTGRMLVGGGTSAVLVINGDRDNSGDAGDEDASLLFAVDGAYSTATNSGLGSNGFRLGCLNGAAVSSFTFTEVLGGSNLERMRIDSSGNVLIGTTATTGSTSNNIMAVSGIFKTISGSSSAAHTVATTLFTAPILGNATYIVSAGINNTGVPSLYAAVSLISVDGATIQATALKTAGNLSISISGRNVRGTQTSGATQNIVFTAIRIH
jgi:hypothetical protein